MLILFNRYWFMSGGFGTSKQICWVQQLHKLYFVITLIFHIEFWMSYLNIINIFLLKNNNCMNFFFFEISKINWCLQYHGTQMHKCKWHLGFNIGPGSGNSLERLGFLSISLLSTLYFIHFIAFSFYFSFIIYTLKPLELKKRGVHTTASAAVLPINSHLCPLSFTHQ